MPILFCNISWMRTYAGRSSDDPPLGGGSFPNSEGYCGEECNFVACDDGYVYGHFETIKGERDRQVRIEKLGASKSDASIDGVDVVWTAPWEGKDPRVVVGWSRNCRLYRQRQPFGDAHPSEVHRRDKIESFMVKAPVENVVLLKPEERRNFELRRGAPGWAGQTSWWYADDTTDADAGRFVADVKAAMDSRRHPLVQARPQAGRDGARSGSKDKGRTGAAASDPYQRYVSAYEARVDPKHHKLQTAFKAYLIARHKGVKFPSCYRDDLRYTVEGESPVMAEIKPADPADLRFAIRTAIGQLLDYSEQQRWCGRTLIVVGSEVRNANDLRLALDNGFGIAWPDGPNSFQLRWPD